VISATQATADIYRLAGVLCLGGVDRIAGLPQGKDKEDLIIVWTGLAVVILTACGAGRCRAVSLPG
jgi:hypothetical protein